MNRNSCIYLGRVKLKSASAVATTTTTTASNIDFCSETSTPTDWQMTLLQDGINQTRASLPTRPSAASGLYPASIMECHPTAVETCFPRKGSEKKRRNRKKRQLSARLIRPWVTNMGWFRCRWYKIYQVDQASPSARSPSLPQKKKPSGIKHCSFRTEGWNVHSDASPVRLAWFR